jgi:hypothetical protein
VVVGIVLIKVSIVYSHLKMACRGRNISEWEKNKKRELTYWNFVAIDGVIGSQGEINHNKLMKK